MITKQEESKEQESKVTVDKSLMAGILDTTESESKDGHLDVDHQEALRESASQELQR